MLLAIGAMAIAGCGGGDDTATASLTKAEFVKQANAICTKNQREMEEQFELFSSKLKDRAGASPNVVKAFKEEVANVAIPGLEKQIEELRALPVPSGEEENVELILERQEETLEKVKEEPEFRTSGGPYEELNKPASDYGLTECSV